MVRPAALLCAAFAAGSPLAKAFEADDISKEFDKFTQAYGKKYSPEERVARLAIFEANFRYIHAENAKGQSFELGLNGHADLNNAEFMNTRLGLIRPNHSKAWGDLPLLGTMVASGATLPSAVDWRKRGAMTPVGNQGHCGACWTFSATGALSAAWQIKTGVLRALSEQQFMDCSHANSGCHGGDMDSAFSYAKTTGLCSADSYPYTAHQSMCRSPDSCNVVIPRGGVLGYRDVQPDNEAALMEAVAQQPVSVGIDGEGMSFQLYKAGVFSHSCGTRPNHAVLLVGYGRSSTGEHYWLLKNSWGSSWGEGGYFRLLRESSGAGQCGVMTMPSYPVVRGGGHHPTAAPPSTTTRGGGSSFYGRPPCQEHEVLGRIFGGVTCAPRCKNGGCPGSVPHGVTAQPRCVLKDTSFWGRFMDIKYCALVCHSSSECAAGAQCVGDGGSIGVCVYPDGGQTSTLLGVAGNATLPAEGTRRLSIEASASSGIFV